MPDMTERAWDPAVDPSADPADALAAARRPASVEEDHHDEEMPRVHITRERVLIFGLFVVVIGLVGDVLSRWVDPRVELV